ncbi:MAG TPA: hypothetical protein VFB50_09260 [Chloroflexota bacterium]|nr:hypothetical protein [Chloroflexota bacterium]
MTLAEFGEARIRAAVDGLSADEILDLIFYLLWVAHFRRYRDAG